MISLSIIDKLRKRYSDSDFATDLDDRKSITGMVQMINGTAITFGSSKQHSVSKSTSEAEAKYIGMTHVAKKVLWARIFMMSNSATK